MVRLASPRGGPQDAEDSAKEATGCAKGEESERRGSGEGGGGRLCAPRRGGGEGGGQKATEGGGERSNTLSSVVHTLVVTRTGKVLAFVKVHRRLSGSSAAPLVRPFEPGFFASRKEATERDPKILLSRLREKSSPVPLFFSISLPFSSSSLTPPPLPLLSLSTATPIRRFPRIRLYRRIDETRRDRDARFSPVCRRSRGGGTIEILVPTEFLDRCRFPNRRQFGSCDRTNHGSDTLVDM